MDKRILYVGAGALVVLIIWVVIPKGKKSPDMQEISVTQSPASSDAKIIYDQAVQLKQQGELLKAKEAYKRIFSEFSDLDNMEAIQHEMEGLNLQIIFSNTPTEETVMHEVVSGDTLGVLAKKYGTTVDLIKRSNNLQNNIIRVGQKLRVWTGQFNVFVDKSQNTLMLKSGNDVVKIYSVSTGSNNSTPIGQYKITSKLVDPVWFNKGIVLPPDSPQNVLGTRWMGFDLPGYGIHGTIEPDAIGQQVTAGCVRMRNEEVEELYSIVPTGTEVVIVD